MNRIFPQQQPDDESGEPTGCLSFEKVFKGLKSERLSELNITYVSGIEVRVKFPDEEDNDAE